MLDPVRSGRFKRDVKLAAKRGKDLGKLRDLLTLLIEEKPLPERYRDHPLKGGRVGYRDAHLEPNWLLIYRIAGSDLYLVRTGSHADLFDE